MNDATETGMLPLSAGGLILRQYQQQTLDTLTYTLDRLEGVHPVVAMPTGSGKSLVIAALAASRPGRVLVVTHRQRLIQQNSAQLARMFAGEDFGIYSAGLGQRDSDQRVLFAGVQSVFRRMDALQEAGAFATIIQDECHLSPPPLVTSMYRRVFDEAPHARRVGFSATPSRMGVPVYNSNATLAWFTHRIVDLNIRDLTPVYLSPLVGVLTAGDVDMSAVHIRQGEFLAHEASTLMSEAHVAKAALHELQLIAAKRQAWILFCCDIAHTHLVAKMLNDLGISCGVMTSDQSADVNTRSLQQFESGQTRALASCIMMTTGFDVPQIDCVALLRPTMSKELLIQMIGRGTRLSPSKTDCLVVDFAGNISRHAPLDELPEVKKSVPKIAKDQRDDEERQRIEDEVQARKLAKARTVRHAMHASTDGLFLDSPAECRKYTVKRITYALRRAKNPPHPHMIMATYYVETGSALKPITIFVCPEHQGYPRRKAEAWFKRRNLQAPALCGNILGALYAAKRPLTIEVNERGAYPDLLSETFSESGTIAASAIW